MNREATPYIAELLGTFGFVFIGATSVAINAQTGSLGILGISLAHGLALLAFIYTFSHVSGAHFNPAITIGLWLTKRIEGSVAAGYVVFQLAGAVLAGILIEGFLGAANLVIPQPATLTAFPATLLEGLFTFCLALVFFGTLVDRRSHTSHAGLAVGLAFTVLMLIGTNLTGAALNPARAFGPAFVANLWKNQIIYWLGPIIGAAAAALIYEHGILKTKD